MTLNNLPKSSTRQLGVVVRKLTFQPACSRFANRQTLPWYQASQREARPKVTTNAKHRGLHLCVRPTGYGSGDRHNSQEAGNSSFFPPGTSVAPEIRASGL